MGNSRFKFRAWNKVANFMIYWDEFVDYEKDQMLIVGKDYRIFNDAEFILQQYTGLKTKNGREIYEGDILKYPVDINNEFHGRFSIHEVLFKKGTYIVSYLKSEKGHLLPRGYTAGFLLDHFDYDNKSFLFNENPSMDTRIEVIGNIYEHSHLFEGAK